MPWPAAATAQRALSQTQKHPLAGDVPATSTDADVAWGLPPAPQPPAAHARRHREAGARRRQRLRLHVPAARHSGAPARSGRPRRSAGSSPGTPTPPRRQRPLPGACPRSPAPVRAAEPAAGNRPAPSEPPGPTPTPTTTGDRPRDEDAPPLDEEPPMDWDPSARRRAAVRPAGRRSPRPLRPKEGRRPSRGIQEPPAPRPGRRRRRRTPPTTRGPVPSSRHPASGRSARIPTSASTAPEESAAPEPTPEPEPPHYEPAAAQIPDYAGVSVRAAAYEPVDCPRRTAGATPPSWCRPALQSASRRVLALPLAVRCRLAGGSLRSRVAVPEARAQPDGPAKPVPAAVEQSRRPRPDGPRLPPARLPQPPYVQDIPSADDETIEESGVFGRAAVERILGGKLVEERSLDGSPLPPRF